MLSNIGKWDSFPGNAFWKMIYFPKNVNVERNGVLIGGAHYVGF